MVSRKPSIRETPPKPTVDGGREAAPYDVDGSQPGLTPPLPKVEEKFQPAPKVDQIIGGGITNEPPLRSPSSTSNNDSPANGSEVWVESEHTKTESSIEIRAATRPAGSTRNVNQGQPTPWDHDRTTGSPAPSSELPISTSAPEKEASGTPLKKSLLQSACGRLHCIDLPLITS
ncbi:hypothetical protein BDM02DRAFT_3117090 [Thelephora ganbajun]|uniref:Uncharacterized protein n=1 Tax=Thelephora ganbajun TaxID=370292 RepID=A0ACB6ZCV9_THEGA|nr:hypothetical protein BDM02DRAFT_3117090 [Thelephora ganbajun]